ncbi:alpha/beta hydrolase [Sphingomonas japonica]|uniref:Alpha/beta hydrolase n=1 Tax=Sphingomonas japonica TaxID=511662 RepID=A0ABX0U0B9_9SPHN|nr:alpha/beta hydrolase [Sphingomonas japonica]NIJ23089.1 hypothetical protein [Sphingomonas japonica]
MDLALFRGSEHAIVTIGGCRGDAPAWQTAFGWPARGDRHIDFQGEGTAARNMLGVHLDQAVAQADRAVLLVASGVGCLAAAWWARLSPSQSVARVAGAVLFAPEDASDAEQERFASPRLRLPFPAILVGGAARPDQDRRLAALAEDWGGSVLTERQPSLRIASDRAGGARSPWRHARRTIARWSAAVVAHEARLAGALSGQDDAFDR